MEYFYSRRSATLSSGAPRYPGILLAEWRRGREDGGSRIQLFLRSCARQDCDLWSSFSVAGKLASIDAPVTFETARARMSRSPLPSHFSPPRDVSAIKGTAFASWTPLETGAGANSLRQRTVLERRRWSGKERGNKKGGKKGFISWWTIEIAGDSELSPARLHPGVSTTWPRFAGS